MGRSGWTRRRTRHLSADEQAGSGELGAQGLPAGEALVEAVPVRDPFLAQLPTEENFFSVPEGGEVDEASIQVLDQAAEGLDLLDPFTQLPCYRFQFFLQLGQGPALCGGAIATDMSPELFHLVLLWAHLVAHGDELFENRPQAGEESVGFIEGEVLLGHSALERDGELSATTAVSLRRHRRSKPTIALPELQAIFNGILDTSVISRLVEAAVGAPLAAPPEGQGKPSRYV